MIERVVQAKAIQERLGLESLEGWDKWNGFSETMLNLQLPEEPKTVSFAQETIAAFHATEAGDFYYPIGQVFEEDVLREVCDIHSVSYDDARFLRWGSSENLDHFRSKFIDLAPLGEADRIVLASVLVTVSRFDMAKEILDYKPSGSERFKFESALLRYIIGNRQEGKALSEDLMTQVRSTVTDEIPAHRVLDAATSAVVWYLKGVGVSREDFEWLARKGNELVSSSESTLPSAQISAWYRGVAMLPAELRDAIRTSFFMEQASIAADRAIRNSDGPFAENLRKTYLESSVKEHMYVTGDQVAALSAAAELVERDPLWSISVGEYADVLARFGKPREAATKYDEAVSLGAPYVSYHLGRAADSYKLAGDFAEAMKRYLMLSKLLPDGKEAYENARALMNQLDEGTPDYDPVKKVLAEGTL